MIIMIVSLKLMSCFCHESEIGHLHADYRNLNGGIIYMFSSPCEPRQGAIPSVMSQWNFSNLRYRIKLKELRHSQTV